MPKLVPTIAVTVVRDGKRKTVEPNKKAFDFTADEVKSVTAVHPTAFRKPVNEDTTEDTGTDATAPEGKAGATATQPPKRKRAEKAAEKDSTSDAATKQTDKQSGEAADTDSGDDGDDDDDI